MNVKASGFAVRCIWGKLVAGRYVHDALFAHDRETGSDGSLRKVTHKIGERTTPS